jgi:DTW domain-containing protein YfiP
MELRSEKHLPKSRDYCRQCIRPAGHCYCAQIKKFDPKVQFVILIHPIEQRRQIATGRMAHLCLEQSTLIPGYNYTEDAQVNAILKNDSLYPVILFPGPTSINLSHLSSETRDGLFPKNKKLVVFVIDGTWNTARKTMHLSGNLKTLPRVCFSPTTPSEFRVRKQPTAECYSTIEAIHQTIELLGTEQGFDLESRHHDQLLNTFRWMVQAQLSTYASAPKLRRVKVDRYGNTVE